MFNDWETRFRLHLLSPTRAAIAAGLAVVLLIVILSAITAGRSTGVPTEFTDVSPTAHITWGR